MPTAYLNDAGVSRLSSNIKDYVDDQLVELTETAYDELTPAEKTNGAVYFVYTPEQNNSSATNE
jgi:hypothetical protein